MKVCKVSDFETAFDFLVAWLKESRDVVTDNMPGPDEKAACAKAEGYLMAVSAGIVLAEDLRNKAMKAGRCKND